MAVYIIQDSTLSGIADAIRDKTGRTEAISVSNMASEIEGISAGSAGSLEKEIVEGTITEYINENIESVCMYAFYLNSKLEHVSLPNCSIIDYGAFERCTSLTTANFPACTTISNAAFCDCTALTTANFPACTTISSRAFHSCTSLTTVNFPACTSIGGSAFYNCKSLTTASFPACSIIGYAAFYSCKSLTTANFPACTTINSSAFNRCTSLTTASFPACTTISSSAFYSCTSLASLILNNSSVVTLADYGAFISTPLSQSNYLGKFGSIYVPSSLVASYKAARNWSKYSRRITSIVE